MPENRGYLPEGLSTPPLYTLEMLRRAVSDGTVLEGTVQRCDGDLNLYLQLGSTSRKSQRGSHRSVDQRCRPGNRRFITGRKAGLFYGGIPLRRRERRADGPALPPEGPGTGYGGNAPRSEAGSRGGGKGGTHGALRGLRGHWPGHRALLPTEYISAAASAIPTSGSGWGRKFWQWPRSLTGKTGGSP